MARSSVRSPHVLPEPGRAHRRRRRSRPRGRRGRRTSAPRAALRAAPRPVSRRSRHASSHAARASGESGTSRSSAPAGMCALRRHRVREPGVRAGGRSPRTRGARISADDSPTSVPAASIRSRRSNRSSSGAERRPRVARALRVAAAALEGLAPTGARVGAGDEQEVGRELERARRPADANHALFERLAQCFEHAGGELGQLVEEERAPVRERDLARPHSGAAAADERDARRGVVRGAEGGPAAERRDRAPRPRRNGCG